MRLGVATLLVLLVSQTAFATEDALPVSKPAISQPQQGQTLSEIWIAYVATPIKNYFAPKPRAGDSDDPIGKTIADIPKEDPKKGVPYFARMTVKSVDGVVKELNKTKKDYLARPKQIEAEVLAANAEYFKRIQANKPSKNAAPEINTPVMQFINSLLHRGKDYLAGRPTVKFSKDLIFVKWGLYGKVQIGQLTEIDGSPLRGSIIGISNNYIYEVVGTQIIQRDVRRNADPAERPIPFGGSIAGFTIWGDQIYSVVQGVGLVSVNEKTLVRIVKPLGDNQFLPGGVEVSPSGFVAVAESLVYKVDFPTGRTYAYSMAEFMASLREPVKLTPNMITDTEIQNTDEGFRRSIIYNNGWVEINTEAGKIIDVKPVDIKIEKFLGVHSDHALFFPEKGKVWENPLVVLNLISGSIPNKAQFIYGAENATAFYIDQNILHLFTGSFDKDNKYQAQDNIYDLSHAVPRRFEIQPIDTSGAMVESAKRIGGEMFTFDNAGDLLNSFPLSEKVLNQNSLVEEACAKPMGNLARQRKFEAKVKSRDLTTPNIKPILTY